MKIFNFLQGLAGFGNLRFAEIKSCPSASPTYLLRKVETGDFMQKMTFYAHFMLQIMPTRTYQKWYELFYKWV